jgi:hypothetical protein
VCGRKAGKYHVRYVGNCSVVHALHNVCVKRDYLPFVIPNTMVAVLETGTGVAYVS